MSELLSHIDLMRHDVEELARLHTWAEGLVARVAARSGQLPDLAAQAGHDLAGAADVRRWALSLSEPVAGDGSVTRAEGLAHLGELLLAARARVIRGGGP